jgi:hypothetical protein
MRNYERRLREVLTGDGVMGDTESDTGENPNQRIGVELNSLGQRPRTKTRRSSP